MTIAALLEAPLFTIVNAPVSTAELLGFVTGAACVWLVAKQHLLNWPIGIANNLFFIYLFVAHGLYAEVGLQVVFITMSIYGWIVWARGGGQAPELPVSRTPMSVMGPLLGAGLACWMALTWLLGTYTDSTVPIWDALATSLSLVATFGQARKQVECWYFWILTDLISVPLYVSKGLNLTAVLYVGFLALCVMGLFEWRRELTARPAEPLPA